MKTMRKEVKTFVEYDMCDCGGKLQDKGVMLPSYPPKYEHTCMICSKVYQLNHTSPRQVLVECDVDQHYTYLKG